MTLRAGERLGPYELLGGLGAGGMGEVYRARDPRLGRTVAIKVLPAATSADPSRRRRPGTVMGTVGYMSPEQVRGEAADHRSDLFALGVVFYEMLTGRRAFHRDSSVETLNAILKEEPAELPPDRQVPSALDRIVRHCLEKKPEDRHQSARDLAFELEGLTGSAVTAAKAAAPAVGRWRQWLLGAAVVLVALAGAFIGGRRTAPPMIPSFRQLTFRRGTVASARFTPDGQTVVYSAAWDGQPGEIASMRTDGPESKPLGLPPGYVASVSSKGELVVVLTSQPQGEASGTLARVPLSLSLSPDGRWFLQSMSPIFQGPDSWQGSRLRLVPTGSGETREVAFPDHIVHWAGWLPDGQRLLLTARERPPRKLRVLVTGLDGKGLRAITPEGVFPRAAATHNRTIAVSDGRRLAVEGPNGVVTLYSVDGTDETREIPGLEPAFHAVRFGDDGRSLFVVAHRGTPTRIYRVDLATGRRALAHELMPPDPIGVTTFTGAFVTPDGRAYAYDYRQVIGNLYLAEGLP